MAKRNKLEQYFTTTEAVDALMFYEPAIDGMILEPCHGTGSITKRLVQHGRSVYTNDTELGFEAHSNYDITFPAIWTEFPKVDYVVSNPPFNVADEILPLAWKHAKAGMAFFLRLSYLEPCDNRGPWLEEHPPARIISVPRISFKKTEKSSTDLVSCAWYIWFKDVHSVSHLYQDRDPIVIVPKLKMLEIKEWANAGIEGGWSSEALKLPPTALTRRVS